MIFPFAVFFFSSISVCSNLCDRRDGDWEARRDPGLDPRGYGEGKVEADVLGGAMSIPRGSLRPDSLDNSRTDPNGELILALSFPISSCSRDSIPLGRKRTRHLLSLFIVQDPHGPHFGPHHVVSTTIRRGWRIRHLLS